MDLKKLAEPFKLEDLEWRPGAVSRKDPPSALALVYVTNRAIMHRLDDVLGPAGWANRFERWGNGAGVLCGLSILVGGSEAFNPWVTKWDGADETQIEPTKGGLSDAMKRAAVQWGIGRYLYELPDFWGPGQLNQKGQFRFDRNWRPDIPSKSLPGPALKTTVPEEVTANHVPAVPIINPDRSKKEGKREHKWASEEGGLSTVPADEAPEWIDEKLGYGKRSFNVNGESVEAAQCTWRFMGSGDHGGGRLGYLEYVVSKAREDYASKKLQPDRHAKRSKALLSLIDKHKTPF